MGDPNAGTMNGESKKERKEDGEKIGVDVAPDDGGIAGDREMPEEQWGKDSGSAHTLTRSTTLDAVMEALKSDSKARAPAYICGGWERVGVALVGITPGHSTVDACYLPQPYLVHTEWKM